MLKVHCTIEVWRIDDINAEYTYAGSCLNLWCPDYQTVAFSAFVYGYCEGSTITVTGSSTAAAAQSSKASAARIAPSVSVDRGYRWVVVLGTLLVAGCAVLVMGIS